MSEEVGSHQVVAGVASPADPESLKKAFGMMIDELISIAGNDIIDWGSLAFKSIRALNPETGQEQIWMYGVATTIGLGE